jgi:bifunctional DNase/RNase
MLWTSACASVDLSCLHVAHTNHRLSAIGYRVTKIRITDVVANTYYARIHLARVNAQVCAAAKHAQQLTIFVADPAI